MFLSLEINLSFFGMFFSSPKNNFSSQKSATNQCARWAEKKQFFLGNALPKFIASAHLKQRKNIVALCSRELQLSRLQGPYSGFIATCKGIPPAAIKLSSTCGLPACQLGH